MEKRKKRKEKERKKKGVGSREQVQRDVAVFFPEGCSCLLGVPTLVPSWGRQN